MNKVNPGFNIEILSDTLEFNYGPDVFGPKAEKRTLDSIRKSLKDPDCIGPEIVYSIAMDVGKIDHRTELIKRMLLFGIVTYASGQLGTEPIRSQGHIHKVSQHSKWSPPELYEIWSGSAFIYMQETANDNPGRCFAVFAEPGDVVLVPPNWAHSTISASAIEPLTFGAWCDREYGFEYDDIRRHRGLAWYPTIQDDGLFKWIHNDNYHYTDLVIKKPNDYVSFGIDKGIPIYTQFERDPNRFQWVSNPKRMKDNWLSFIP